MSADGVTTGAGAAPDDALATFERHRHRLRGLAYRMLGSVGDTDDLLQEAFLRWHQADRRLIRSPEAWLCAAVTRLAVDRLRRLAAERAAYVGPWLPEPWFEPVAHGPGDRIELLGDLSVAFLLLLERLSPEERAALLLRDVFDVGYPAIAATLGKSMAACRQTVRRARDRLRTGRRRFAVTHEARRRVLQQFLAAAEVGDEAAVLALLAPDATYMADGGGKAPAARRVVLGAPRITRLIVGAWRKRLHAMVHRVGMVNGAPGILSWADGQPFATLSVDTDGATIHSVHWVLNPEKLTRFPALETVGGQDGR